MTTKKRTTRVELYSRVSIQDRGEFVRVLLMDDGVACVDVAREPKNGLTFMMRLPRRPEARCAAFAAPFVTRGDVIVSQTANILAFLAPRFGLVPDEEALG